MFFADMFTERNPHADVSRSSTSSMRYQAWRCRGPPRADRLPAIILSGSEDGTHQAAFALKDRIPNCEMKILHGAGHACQIEQPWLFDRLMIEFLRKHDLFPSRG